MAAWLQQVVPGFWPAWIIVVAGLLVPLHVARWIYEPTAQFWHPRTPGSVVTDFGLPFAAGWLNDVMGKHATTNAWYESLGLLGAMFIVAFIGCTAKVYFAEVRGKAAGWHGVSVPERVHTLVFALNFAFIGFLLIQTSLDRHPTREYVAAVILIAIWALATFGFDVFIFPKISPDPSASSTTAPAS